MCVFKNDFMSLSYPKVLSFGKIKKHLAFRSLIRIFASQKRIV